MDFGVVLQTNPPAWRTVDLARQAETHGFEYVWTFDSHLLWQEPFVIYSAILAATHRVTVGPMVTNPATRDWSVIASHFATLNEMFGNRTICGIGRGDSAVRTLNGRPSNLATLEDSIAVIRDLGNSRAAVLNPGTDGERRVQFPWSHGSALDVWVAAYGPKALDLTGRVGDGFILQLADPDIARWMIRAVRDSAEAAGRDPDEVDICVAAPAYVGDGAAPAERAHMREQCRWFGGMVGNHVAEIVRRYGTDSAVPKALTDYVRDREGYDYNQHGRAGNTHTTFVSDEIVERFCLLGSPHEHVERLRELESLGTTQFAVYLQHDNKEETMRLYGERVIPAMAHPVTATS